MSKYLFRITETVLLAVTGNILVNYLLSPNDPDWIVEEFVVAFFLCIPITEAGRLFDSKIDEFVTWSTSPITRFFSHFIFLAIVIGVMLNIIGGIYWTYIDHINFTFSEYVLMNVVALILVFILTVVKWCFAFLNKWRASQLELDTVSILHKELNDKLKDIDSTLTLKKGNDTVLIKQREIQMAFTENSVVFMQSLNDKFIYESNLTDLCEKLSSDHFFRISRDKIINRSTIDRFKSGSYGKVDLTLRISEEHLKATVSRPRAAQFRAWINSNSSR